MILKIDKDYFKKLTTGEHTLKINFKDGYAEGNFTVGNKITFTILGTEFTATDGMTWGDWIESYGIGTSGNYILWVKPITNTLYIDHRYHASWDQGLGLGAEEDLFYDSNDVPQTLNTPIINKGSYGRSSGAPC